MDRMVQIKKLLIIIPCLCLFAKCVIAQPALQETKWMGSLQLSFTHDSLLVSNLTNSQSTSLYIYKQRADTLFVSTPGKTDPCGTAQGIYQIKYQHNKQNVFFTAIQDTCGYRKGLLTPSLPFNFIPGENSAARDWLALDPGADSIAGTSLYKACALLTGRDSEPVIVAVIDNGVDIGHEDLKNFIWTNKKEKPDNGQDDDQNGYVDDLHGWNFRGKKDGTIIENEQAEATHLYAGWKDKYDHADISKLNEQEKKKYAMYAKAKKQYLDKIVMSKDSFELKFA